MIKKVFSGIRKLYNWCMSWADHPHGIKALCCFSFIESVFFPIPVDPLLVAMSAGKPKKSLYFALWATIFSVLGAFGGYALGLGFWDIIQNHIITEGGEFESHFHMAQNMFQDNAMWTMVLAGFTFLPFKIFTITAGVFGVELIPFFIGCVMGRSARFFLIGGLLYIFGAKMRRVIEVHFEMVTILVGAFILLGLFSYKLLW